MTLISLVHKGKPGWHAGLWYDVERGDRAQLIPWGTGPTMRAAVMAARDQAKAEAHGESFWVPVAEDAWHRFSLML